MYEVSEAQHQITVIFRIRLELYCVRLAASVSLDQRPEIPARFNSGRAALHPAKWSQVGRMKMSLDKSCVLRSLKRGPRWRLTREPRQPERDIGTS